MRKPERMRTAAPYFILPRANKSARAEFRVPVEKASTLRRLVGFALLHHAPASLPPDFRRVAPSEGELANCVSL